MTTLYTCQTLVPSADQRELARDDIFKKTTMAEQSKEVRGILDSVSYIVNQKVDSNNREDLKQEFVEDCF